MVKRLIKFPRGDFTFYEAEPRRETWLIAAGGVILSMHSKTEGRWLMILPHQLICYRNCLLLTLLDDMSAVSSLSAPAYGKRQLLSLQLGSLLSIIAPDICRPWLKMIWFPLQSINWVGVVVDFVKSTRKKAYPLNWILWRRWKFSAKRSWYSRRRDNGLYVHLDVVSLEFAPPSSLSLRNRTITRKII